MISGRGKSVDDPLSHLRPPYLSLSSFPGGFIQETGDRAGVGTLGVAPGGQCPRCLQLWSCAKDGRSDGGPGESGSWALVVDPGCPRFLCSTRETRFVERLGLGSAHDAIGTYSPRTPRPVCFRLLLGEFSTATGLLNAPSIRVRVSEPREANSFLFD